MAGLGVSAIIYTDIHRDGTLQGPNLEALRELVAAMVKDRSESIAIPVIASGGISSVTDLFNLLPLEPLGVAGVIIGRAIYTGAVDLKSAVRAVGPGRWQDIPLDFGSTTIA